MDDTITFDDDGFGNPGARILWADIVAVGIRTTDDGPMGEDVFWQFLLRKGFFELPGEIVAGAVFAGLQRYLVGMDSHKIMLAMRSTNNRSFRVWHVSESLTGWDDGRMGARFSALCERLGGASAGPAFERLRTAWAADGRDYHNLEHLADCLRELDGARADDADVAELALWYHDAIYVPADGNCEARSAAMLVSECAALGIEPEVAERAAAMVRATTHRGAVEVDALTALVLDVDLSILGRDPLRFMEFEYAVEAEYAHIPAAAFSRGRARFLEGVLATPSIYRTDYFRARYERIARNSIKALLASPRYSDVTG